MINRAKGTLGFFRTFDLYPVTEEWRQELYNYFIEGFHPGSFHEALFANDLTSAVFKSHPANTWEAIRAFVKWNFANAPAGSIGNYESVKDWLTMTAEERTAICIGRGWMLTEEELSWKIINDEAV